MQTSVTSEPLRDYVGYGANPPNPHWPGGARIALNIVLNYEEGSELSFERGDGVTEGGLTEGGGGSFAGRDLGAETMYEYGSRVGVWRLLRILRDRDMTATVFACAEALSRNRQVTKAFCDAGFDFCSHGLRWVRHQTLDEAQERQAIAQAYRIITQETGTAPIGWYCRYAPTENTRRLLVEHGGFVYDSDSYADELPYWVTQDTKPHLVIPYSLAANDTKFSRGAMATGSDLFDYLRETFDVLYEEGRDQPKLMTMGLHMRIAGHPGRASGFARFLDYVASKPKGDVWVCRRADVARHWLAVHPFDGAK